MNDTQAQNLIAPPSLMKALKAGFDVIANHIGLIFFPVSLDLFLWLGPRLRLTRLVEGYLQMMASLPGMTDLPKSTDLIQMNQELWNEIGQRLNLFSSLRAYPVGIPSLVISIQPLETPLGAPAFRELSTAGEALAVTLALTTLGLVAGTLYYTVVAQATQPGGMQWGKILSKWPRDALRVILLTLLMVVLLFAVFIPGSCLISFMAMGGLMLGQIGVMALGALLVWLAFPLAFSPHGIIANQSPVWTAVRDSIRLARYAFPTTSLYFLVVVLISEGLDILWRAPGEASWLLLLAIAGHGFVTTGLLASSFIYYHDATIWVDRVVQQIRLRAI